MITESPQIAQITQNEKVGHKKAQNAQEKTQAAEQRRQLTVITIRLRLDFPLCLLCLFVAAFLIREICAICGYFLETL